MPRAWLLRKNFYDKLSEPKRFRNGRDRRAHLQHDVDVPGPARALRDRQLAHQNRLATTGGGRVEQLGLISARSCSAARRFAMAAPVAPWFLLKIGMLNCSPATAVLRPEVRLYPNSANIRPAIDRWGNPSRRTSS